MRAPDLLYAVPPQDIVDFAHKRGLNPNAKLSRAERLLLARIGACPRSCELYIEEKANAMCKTVVYLDGGKLVAPVPNESDPTSYEAPDLRQSELEQ